MHVFMLALTILDDRYTLPSLASAQCTRNYVHDVHELPCTAEKVHTLNSKLSIPDQSYFRCKSRLCLRLSSWTQSA